LIPGVPPAHKADCKAATARICQAVLGRSDYQLGKTKVFLKDAHDLFLEQERDRVLTRYIVVLQKNIKTWVYRRRFMKLRTATRIVSWRNYNYIIMFLFYIIYSFIYFLVRFNNIGGLMLKGGATLR
jgi:myosin VIIa